jgi:hypothetical protein
MERSKRMTTRPTLAEVEERFRQWRRTRETRTSRIPEQLWLAAGAVAQQCTISEVARALRVEHNKLKRYCPKGSKAEGRGGNARGFVEVEMAGAPSAVSRAAAEWVLEVEEETGRKLKVSVRGITARDAVEVVEALWGQGR